MQCIFPATRSNRYIGKAKGRQMLAWRLKTSTIMCAFARSDPEARRPELRRRTALSWAQAPDPPLRPASSAPCDGF